MASISDVTPATPTAAETCEIFQSDADKVARVRSTLVASGDLAVLAETFKILGDPTRVRLLDALSKAELCVCDLANLLGLSESAVSHQLRLLRGARVVRARRDGRMVFYTLDDQHVRGLFQQGLRHVEEGSSVSDRERRATRDSGRASATPRRALASPAEEPGEADLVRRGAWE